MFEPCAYRGDYASENRRKRERRTGKVIVAIMKMATKIGVIAELRLKAVTTNAVTMKSAENANSSKYMLKKRSATIALFLSGIGIRMSKDACS